MEVSSAVVVLMVIMEMASLAEVLQIIALKCFEEKNLDILESILLLYNQWKVGCIEFSHFHSEYWHSLQAFSCIDALKNTFLMCLRLPIYGQGHNGFSVISSLC